MEENTVLKQAKADLEQFLQENPNMLEYQREIELALMGISDSALRVSILMKKISNNMSEIKGLSGELANQLSKGLPKELK